MRTSKSAQFVDLPVKSGAPSELGKQIWQCELANSEWITGFSPHC